jgi:hypothetical protein
VNLLEVWDELESALPVGRPGRQQRRILHESPANLFVAVTSPDGRRCLTLTVDDSAVADVDTLPSARGLEILLHRAGAEGRSTLELQLVDPALLEVFGSLAWDVANVVSAQADDTSAVRAWLSRVMLWQRMLSRAARGLPTQAQRGLWGELWLLTQKLAPVFGVERAVDAWTGPAGSVHDFQTSRGSLEVKTSAAHEPQIVRINGERQLDDAFVPSLHLVHLSIEVRHRTGSTLPASVENARALVAGTTAALPFEDRLLAYGYLDIHADLYAQTGYELREAELFRVGVGFPRIIEHELPDGIGRVHYDLAIAACADHRVDFAQVLITLAAA